MNSRNDNMILELQQDTEPPVCLLTVISYAVVDAIAFSASVGWASERASK